MGENENSVHLRPLPLLLFLLLLLFSFDIFRRWRDEMSQFLQSGMKRSLMGTNRSPLPSSPRTFSSLFQPLASSESLLSPHFSAPGYFPPPPEGCIWPSGIIRWFSLPPAAEIISAGLIKAGGGCWAGVTANQAGGIQVAVCCQAARRVPAYPGSPGGGALSSVRPDFCLLVFCLLWSGEHHEALQMDSSDALPSP